MIVNLLGEFCSVKGVVASQFDELDLVGTLSVDRIAFSFENESRLPLVISLSIALATARQFLFND